MGGVIPNPLSRHNENVNMVAKRINFSIIKVGLNLILESF